MQMLMKDCGIFDEVFIHVNGLTQQVQHFNTTAMLHFAVEHPAEVNVGKMVIDQALVDYITKTRGVEEWKVQRLKPPYSDIPALGVFLTETDTKPLQVDGHHRIIRAWRDGKKEINAFVFPYGVWQPFLISDVPKWLEEVVVADVKASCKPYNGPK